MLNRTPSHAIAFFLSLITVSLAPQALAEPEPFKIGVIAPLTGPTQSYGVAIKNGVEMGLKDNPQAAIKVIYEDDQFIPAKSVTAAHRLIEVEKVDLLIVGGSTPSNAVAPIAQAKGVPLAAWASDRRVSLNRPFVFRSYPSGETEGAAVASEALRRDFRKIAILTSNNDYTQSWRNGVVQTLPKELMAWDEILTGNQNDLKPLLIRARASEINDFLVCIDSGGVGLLAKQAKELGMKIRIGGCQYLEDSEEVKISQGALVGTWSFAVPITPKFHERVMREIGSDSVISGVANQYDLISSLAEVIKNGKPKNLIEALTALGERSGAVGPYKLEASSDDRFMDIPLILRTVPAVKQ